MRDRPSLIRRAVRFVLRAVWAGIVTGADVSDPRPRRDPPRRAGRDARRDHQHPLL